MVSCVRVVSSVRELCEGEGEQCEGGNERYMHVMGGRAMGCPVRGDQCNWVQV